MNRLFITAFLLLTLCIPHCARAQNYTFRHLTPADGLAQISVNTIYIDEFGFVWAGTRDGLSRYDGNSILTFRLEKENPYSLFCNTIQYLTGDRRGHLYLLGEEGVAEYDMRTNRFTTLVEGSVGAIAYADALLFGVGSEVRKLDAQTQTRSLLYRLPGVDTQISGLLVGADSSLWVGTTRNGLFRLRSASAIERVLPDVHVSRLYEGSDCSLWVGTWDSGLYRILPDGTIVNYRHNQGNEQTLSSDFVRDCCEDGIGNLWIGTYRGLNCLNLASGEITRINSHINRPGSLTHESVWCIKADEQGTLWIGTYFGGINFFNPRVDIYSYYAPSDREGAGLSSPIVGRMAEGLDSTLWIATEGGGVNLLDRRTGAITWFRRSSTDRKLADNNVKALYFDRQSNRLYIGSHLGGIDCFSLNENAWRHFGYQRGHSEMLPSNTVRSIVGYGDSLVVGTQRGVCILDKLSGLGRRLSLGAQAVVAADLYLSTDSVLWIAATGEGLFAYDLATGSVCNYRHSSDVNSLCNNNINSITPASDGSLWLATAGGGLDRFNPRSNRFDNFDSRTHALISDCVYGACETADGRLIAVSNMGYSVLDPARDKFDNFTAKRGFPLTSVNENGLHRCADGTIFIGGIDGMVSFDERIACATVPACRILFSGLSLDGNPILPGDGSNLLDEAIIATREVRIPSGRSVVSFDVMTTNFIAPDANALEYHLSGFGNDWVPMHDDRRITLTNLSPGSYTLRVRDRNNLAITQASIKFRVMPPFYRTVWAYILYACLVALLLWLMVRAYRQRIRLQESLRYESRRRTDIEELNNQKQRFFINVAHEFRTPLTLIAGHAQMLMEEGHDLSTAGYAHLNGIYSNCGELQTLIGELLDFQKQDRGMMRLRVWQHDLSAFVAEAALLFAEQAQLKHIELRTELPAEAVSAWFDTVQMQKVLNNLLSNALKYTSAGGTVTLRVGLAEAPFFEVADTGQGISPDDIDKVFDRFYQGEHARSGTGIGLAFARSIVQAHKGTIGVTSEPGRGATFRVTLPARRDAFADEELCEPALDAANLSAEEFPQLNAGQTAGADSDANAPEQCAEPQKAKFKMLVVEDNDSLRSMLAEIFSGFYEVRTAADGREAWQLVHESLPDIVVTDVMMPVWSGIDLCKKIKEDVDTCHIPVVMLTARAAAEQTMEGLRCGADDYVAKPFDVRLLVARCHNLINSRTLLQEKFSRQPQASPMMLATNAMDKQFLDRAEELILAHLDDTDFDVNSFAREMGMSRTRFFEKLKAVTGRTPNEFVSLIRLKRAASLLASEPDMSVTEISERVGFSSARYFAKCFKDQYHVAPLAYRQSFKEGQG